MSNNHCGYEEDEEVFVYSTGPIENQFDLDGTIAKTVWVKILNNNFRRKIFAEIKVFHLDGTKKIIGKEKLEINPQSSSFAVFDVSNTFEYEVQIKVNEFGGLISVFSKDAAGNLVAAQRVLNKELTRII